MELRKLYTLWSLLGDVPVDDEGNIERRFSVFLPYTLFPVGTPREDIWHWFEQQNPRFIVGEVMEGIRHTDEEADNG